MSLRDSERWPLSSGEVEASGPGKGMRTCDWAGAHEPPVRCGAGVCLRSLSLISCDPSHPAWNVICIAIFVLLTSAFPAAAQTRLTRDGRLKRDPVFDPQGKSIIYAVQASKPRWVLKSLLLGRESAKPQRLHPQAILPEFRPLFARNGSAMGYLQMTGNDVLRLKVKILAKAKPQTVTIKSPRTTVWHIGLSPDGKQVYYNAAGQIATQGVPGGKERVITRSAGRNNWPSVSPNGKRLAFGSSRDGNHEIYTMKVDGKDVRRLTKSAGLDMRPTWSPDGKHIAFVSNRDGNYELYVMRHDGSRQRRLTRNEERDDYPAWHPDGKLLVYVSERNGRYDLFTLRVSSNR